MQQLFFSSADPTAHRWAKGSWYGSKSSDLRVVTVCKSGTRATRRPWSGRAR